ncbi:MAG: 2-dehydropantoate 2-reductase [Anaerolineales bacterium]|nr:2-dehydropantoate 2-reductase [Anaerolineales bacterium]
MYQVLTHLAPCTLHLAPRTRIGLVGIGALGCLFASRLTAVSGVEVVMLGHWPEQLMALRQRGLIVEELDGSRTTHLIEVTNQPTAVRPVDIALILVKSYQTRTAAQETAQWLKPHGLAITLQNGLGNREILAEALGAERVAVGTTSQGATVVAPGVVRHAGEADSYLEEGAAVLAPFLRQAGFTTHVTAGSHGVQGVIWGKLAINAGINPLTALVRQPNGYLAENPHAERLARAAASEAAAVAQAQGIALPYGYAQAGQQVIDICRATAVNRSSMLQDVSRGARTEIEAITGQIVAHGRGFGVPTPANNILLRFMRVYEEYRLAKYPTHAIPVANLIQLYEEESRAFT